MKRTFLKNWMVVALFAGACCGMVACDDDDNGGQTPPPTDLDITAVIGEYAGTMSVVEAVAPVAHAEGEEPAGTALDAKVTGDAIEFTDFPIRDLIVKVLEGMGTPAEDEMVDAIIAAVGQVDYKVPYTALMSEDKATVKLTLAPEALKLTLSDGSEGGEPTAAEEPAGIEIEVTITADAEGAYTVDSKKLAFELAVTGIKDKDVDLPEFEPFSLRFDLTKK